MGTLHGRDYTYCRASDQKRQERHCHYFRRRSRRVRSRRPDKLAVIRQKNEIKATVRKKSLVKIFHHASELLLMCFCFLMVFLWIVDSENTWKQSPTVRAFQPSPSRLNHNMLCGLHYYIIYRQKMTTYPVMLRLLRGFMIKAVYNRALNRQEVLLSA